jgi:hypothetical protein
MHWYCGKRMLIAAQPVLSQISCSPLSGSLVVRCSQLFSVAKRPHRNIQTDSFTTVRPSYCSVLRWLGTGFHAQSTHDSKVLPLTHIQKFTFLIK